MDSKSIGARLRARREQLGMDRADVAAHLGISVTGYGYYESGRSDMAATTLGRLAQLLRCPVGYFFGEAGEEGETLNEEEAISYYRGIPPSLKPAARAVLKTMFEQADRDETTHGKKAE